MTLLYILYFSVWYQKPPTERNKMAELTGTRIITLDITKNHGTYCVQTFSGTYYYLRLLASEQFRVMVYSSGNKTYGSLRTAFMACEHKNCCSGNYVEIGSPMHFISVERQNALRSRTTAVVAIVEVDETRFLESVSLTHSLVLPFYLL
jgi:hypothetical protein